MTATTPDRALGHLTNQMLDFGSPYHPGRVRWIKYFMSTTRIAFRVARIAALAISAFGGASFAAQQGPLAPPKRPDVVRIPTNPAPEKAPIPPEEIIRRFSAQEDAYARAVTNYTYRRTVRLEELGPDGRASGRAEIVTEIVVGDDGARRQRPVSRTDSTLHVLALEPDALEALGRMATFPFGESQVSDYNFLYQTSEPVDDLTTYVFRVTPKRLDRTHAYFTGLIWVDDHDLAVVKSFGKWVSELGDFTLPDLPFNMFETYRQPVSNKYWMPAYTRSDNSAEQSGTTVPVRLVILWDHYAPVGSKASTATAATVPPSSSTPSAKTPSSNSEAPAQPPALAEPHADSAHSTP